MIRRINCKTCVHYDMCAHVDYPKHLSKKLLNTKDFEKLENDIIFHVDFTCGKYQEKLYF